MRNDWPVEHICAKCLRYSPDGLDDHDHCPECGLQEEPHKQDV